MRAQIALTIQTVVNNFPRIYSVLRVFVGFFEPMKQNLLVRALNHRVIHQIFW